MAVYLLQQEDAAADSGFNTSCSGVAAGSVTSDHQILRGGTAGSTEVLPDPDNATSSILAFQSDTALPEPNVTTWQAGDYVVRLNVTTARSAVLWVATYICERTSGGTYNPVASLTGQTTAMNAGTQTMTVNRGADYAAAATSTVYIVCVFQGPAHGGSDVGVTPSLIIDTPIDDAAATFVEMDASASLSLSNAASQNVLRPLGGDFNSILTALGDLNILFDLNGDFNSSLSGSGLIGAVFDWDGDFNGSLTALAELAKSLNLNGSFDGSLAGAAEIQALKGLYGNLSASLTAEAILNAPINLDGLFNGTLIVAALQNVIRNMDGTFTSSIALNSELTRIRSMSGLMETGFLGEIVAPVIKGITESVEAGNELIHDVIFHASLAVGDLIIISATADGAGTFTPPTDFEVIRSSSQGEAKNEVWRKIATAADVSAGADTWQVSFGQESVTHCYIIEAGTFNSASIINASSQNVGTDAAPVANSITTTVDKCLIIGTVGADRPKEDSDANATPSGWTLGGNVQSSASTTNACTGIIFHKTQDVAGATGDATSSITSADGWNAIQIAIEPIGPNSSLIEGLLGVQFDISGDFSSTLASDGIIGITKDFNGLFTGSLQNLGALSRIRSLDGLLGASLTSDGELEIVGGAAFIDMDALANFTLTNQARVNVLKSLVGDFNSSLINSAILSTLVPMHGSAGFSLNIIGELTLSAIIDFVGDFISSITADSQLQILRNLHGSFDTSLTIDASQSVLVSLNSDFAGSLTVNALLNSLTNLHGQFDSQLVSDAILGVVFDINGSFDTQSTFDGKLGIYVNMDGDISASLIIDGQLQKFANLFGTSQFSLINSGDLNSLIGFWGSFDAVMTSAGELEGVSDIIYDIGGVSVSIKTPSGSVTVSSNVFGGITTQVKP